MVMLLSSAAATLLAENSDVLLQVIEFWHRNLVYGKLQSYY